MGTFTAPLRLANKALRQQFVRMERISDDSDFFWSWQHVAAAKLCPGRQISRADTDLPRPISAKSLGTPHPAAHNSSAPPRTTIHVPAGGLEDGGELRVRGAKVLLGLLEEPRDARRSVVSPESWPRS